MSKAQRDKGKVGERKAAAFLRELGFTARRAVQYNGDAGNADLIVIDLPDVFIEVKYGYGQHDLASRAVVEWYMKADAQAGDREPCILWFPPRRDPRLIYLNAGRLVATWGNVPIAMTLQELQKNARAA